MDFGRRRRRRFICHNLLTTPTILRAENLMVCASVPPFFIIGDGNNK